PRQKRATCQPAASISQSTATPNRSPARASTCFTCALVRAGRPLDDKGAIRVVTVDGVGLRDRCIEQLGDEVGSDGADLRELEGGVSKGAVVDRDLHALGRFGLFGEGSRTADPSHHLAQLLVKGQAG